MIYLGAVFRREHHFSFCLCFPEAKAKNPETFDENLLLGFDCCRDQSCSRCGIVQVADSSWLDLRHLQGALQGQSLLEHLR